MNCKGRSLVLLNKQGSLWGGAQATHCQGGLSWKTKLPWSLEKASIFCNPQGGNDSKREGNYPGPTSFPGEQTLEVKHLPFLSCGSPVMDLSCVGIWPCSLVFHKIKLPEKSTDLTMLSPDPNPRHLWKISFILYEQEEFTNPLLFYF